VGFLEVFDITFHAPRGVDQQGCLNSCLSSEGIPWAVIAIVSSVCTGVCIFTAMIGCVACIALVIDGSTATAGACVAHCSSPWWCLWC